MVNVFETNDGAQAKYEFLFDSDLPHYHLMWGTKIFHYFCSIEQTKILLQKADDEFFLSESAFIQVLQFFDAFLPDMVLSLARADVYALDEKITTYPTMKQTYQDLLAGVYVSVCVDYLPNWKRHLEVLIPEAELHLKALIDEYVYDFGDLKVIFSSSKQLGMTVKKVL